MIGQWFARIGLIVPFLLTAAASPATAEVITIKHGSFVWPETQAGRIVLSGNRGFRLQVGTQTGIFNPWDRCSSVPECQPGTVVEIAARWSGNDLPGTAALRGRTYDDVGSANSFNGARVEFDGQITMPPMAIRTLLLLALFRELRALRGDAVTSAFGQAEGGTRPAASTSAASPARG